MVKHVEKKIKKGQGTCEQGFVISRFFSRYVTISKAKNIVHYTEYFIKSRLWFDCYGEHMLPFLGSLLCPGSTVKKKKM